MYSMRESWTDKRLDDFAADTGRRFDRVDERFDKVDGRLGKVENRLSKVEGRLEGVDKRLDSMERSMGDGLARVDADLRELRTQIADFQRTAIQLAAGTMATFVVGFAGLIAAQL